ncbi:MAG: hypothetical protein ACOYNI_13065, partial [Acidimicrobiia bacterium]
MYPATNNTSSGKLFAVTASNVSIAGFMIDGDNPSLSGGTAFGGVDSNCARALRTENRAASSRPVVSGIVFDRNVVKNFTTTGFYMFPDSPASNSSGNHVRQNLFSNMRFRGVYTQNEVEVSIEDNVFDAVHTGIAISSVGLAAATGFEPRITGNTINLVPTGLASRHMGISVNHRYNSAVRHVVSGNTINADATITNNGEGIRITSAVFGGSVHALSNTINANGSLATGYWVWNTDGQGETLISGGSVTGAKTNGLYLTDYDTAYSANSYSTGNVAIVDGVSLGATATGTAINVHWTGTGSNLGPCTLTMRNGAGVAGTGAGVAMNGAKARVNFSGASPAQFAGSLASYITLLNAGATNPATEVDATAVSFDSVAASAATVAQLLAAEDKITHKQDNTALGLVRVKAGELYVTTNSGSIQRGVDNATAADIVNVGSGTYAEQLEIAKALVLRGPNAGKAGNDPTRSAEATIEFPASAPNGSQLVDASADNIALEGLDLRSQDSRITAAGTYSYLWFSYGLNNLTFRNNRMYGSEIPIYIYPAVGGVSKTGLLIEGNYIDCGPWVNSSYNRGMYLGNVAGVVQDNVVLNAHIGIQYMPYGNAATGTIARNTVSAGGIGLYHNYQSLGAGAVAWTDNVVTVAANDRSGLKALVDGRYTAPIDFRGIQVSTFGTNQSTTGTSTPSASFTSNSVDASVGASGYNTLAREAVRMTVGGVYSSGTLAFNDNSFTGWTKAVNNALATAWNMSCTWWGTSAGHLIAAGVSGPA